VQADDARVARAELDEHVLLRERDLELIVPLQVALVEDLDRVDDAGRAVRGLHDLSGQDGRTRVAISAGPVRAGDGGRTVEYAPSPSTSPKSKSAGVAPRTAELLRPPRPLDGGRERAGDVVPDLAAGAGSSGAPSSLRR
jgi:hypothetical protein